MKSARTTAAAFLVLLGSMVIVVWALSVQTVRGIEDGTAADALVANVLEAPETADFVADQVQVALQEQVEGRLGSAALVLLDDQVHNIVVSALGSDVVTSALGEGADRFKNRLFVEVTDRERAPGPFVVTVDLATRVNDRIDEVPILGAFVPDIEIEPLEVEVIPEDTFEDVRIAYRALVISATWFIWLGLGLIGGGVAIAPRRARFFPRALLGAGILGIAVSLTVGAVGPQTLASFMPGGREGGAGRLMEDVVADTALGPITHILLVLGLVALGLAALFAVAVRFMPRSEVIHAEEAGEEALAPSPA